MTETDASNRELATSAGDNIDEFSDADPLLTESLMMDEIDLFSDWQELTVLETSLAEQQQESSPERAAPTAQITVHVDQQRHDEPTTNPQPVLPLPTLPTVSVSTAPPVPATLAMPTTPAIPIELRTQSLMRSLPPATVLPPKLSPAPLTQRRAPPTILQEASSRPPVTPSCNLCGTHQRGTTSSYHR